MEMTGWEQSMKNASKTNVPPSLKHEDFALGNGERGAFCWEKREKRFRFCTIEPRFSGEPDYIFPGETLKDLSGAAVGKIWGGG